MSAWMWMGWSFEQWREAFKDCGEPWSAALWASLLMGHEEAEQRAIGVMERWTERHAYDPLRSPIVLPDSYRTRPRAEGATC